MKTNTIQVVALSLLLAGSSAFAAETVIVGGEAMYPSKDIIDNAVKSADHTTLVTAVKAAGLVETLKGKGPFTVFAPTNAAFSKLPAGTVEKLVEPASKEALTGILTYHVVPGRITFDVLAEKIKEGKGKAKIETASGGVLWAAMNGPHNIVIKDAQGHEANIATYDVVQSNGVIHVIDSVLMPGK